MKRIALIIFLFSVLNHTLRSQNAAACNAAQPVCSNPNFQFVSSAGNGLTPGLTISNPSTNPQMGNGNNPLAPPNSGCHLANAPGPQWLLLTVSSSGALGFSFGAIGSANPQAGFYDWEMWPYSPTACANIFGNTLPPAACNWNASSSGGTGMGSVPVGATPQNFQPSINVVAGQQFVICISNWSGVTTPVSFSNTGTAGLSCNPFVIPGQTICQGSSAVLTGSTNLTGASSTITPGGNVSLGSNISFTMSPATTTNYTITLTGTDPNLMTVTTVTTVTSITVLNPTVAVNSASTVCQGSSVNLTALATGTAVTYNWSGPGGYSNATQNPVLNNLIPSQSGNYIVTANVTTGTLVCTATNTTNVTVIPVAQVTVAPSVVSVCENSSFVLNSGAANATSYSWVGPAYASAAQNPSFSNVVPAMTGIYTVTASFSANNVVCSTSNTVDVTVKPLVNFTLAPLPNICDNTTLVIQGPVGATSYTWTGPNNYVSHTQNLNIPNINSNQSGTYTLVVNVNGCITSDSIPVVVLTPVTFTTIPTNKTICQGDTVSIHAGVTGGSGVYNIVWSPGAGLMPPFGTYAIASPNNSTFYTITANDIACPMNLINTTFVVYVNPLPQPNVQASIIQGCVPLCVDFQSGSSPQAVSVGWNFGQGQLASGDPMTYCFKSAGTYSITTTILDVNGCRSVKTAPFVITAFPRPGPDFSWDPSEVSFIDNHVSFFSTSQSGSIVAQYWDFGDWTNNPSTNSSSIKNPSHEYTAIGNYPVTIIQTNAWGCTDTLIKVLDVIEDFTMYIPNAFTPNGDGLNDVFQPKGMGWKPDQYEFLIYDRWGNLLFKTNDYSKGWDGTIKGVAVQSDVYIYKIKAVSSAHSDRKDFAGHVTLIK
ncbi:MAG TPA: T9SS type B sorting domain-containing protein [Bacteroidia bacterium]|nr:T9SS type B sorting domain-containing protein [Bacteroidia bacterium]